MKLNREILNHFNCDKCRCWWSIGSAEFSVGEKLFCPWCGVENVITEIDDKGNVVNPFDEMPGGGT